MVIQRTKLTQGPSGVGTMYRAVDQWPGRRVTYSIEITDYEPGARLAARWSEPLNGQSEAEFSSVADGRTRLAWKAETHPSGVMGLLSPLMNFWAVRQSKSYLRSFKQWVEGQ